MYNILHNILHSKEIVLHAVHATKMPLCMQDLAEFGHTPQTRVGWGGDYSERGRGRDQEIQISNSVITI